MSRDNKLVSLQNSDIVYVHVVLTVSLVLLTLSCPNKLHVHPPMSSTLFGMTCLPFPKECLYTRLRGSQAILDRLKERKLPCCLASSYVHIAFAVLASYSLPPERIERPRRPPFPGSRREGGVNKLARFDAYG
jgi:hypothetical protein